MPRKLCEVSNDQILERLKAQGWTTSSDIYATFGQDRKSALKRLKRLEALKLVKPNGTVSTRHNTQGPTTVYVLADPDADMAELKAASRKTVSQIQSRPATRIPNGTTLWDAWATAHA